MRKILTIRTGAVAAVAALFLPACGSSGSSDDAESAFRIVATTSVHADIVRSALGDAVPGTVVVESVIPPGGDPHDFAPSAKQAETMEDADLLVVNGLDLEEGLTGIIDTVADDGTPVFTFADHLDTIPADGDPHLWMDPVAIASVVASLEAALIEAGIAEDSIAGSVDSYLGELADLDAEVAALFEPIPVERRVMVTNHDSFGYFADRYGLEVVGAVIPSLTTTADVSPSQLDDLADVMERRAVTAIFGETTESDRLATALAEQVGQDVSVVELFSGSLGPEGSGAETYLSMIATDARLISGALAA